jgi:hypothetical protein
VSSNDELCCCIDSISTEYLCTYMACSADSMCGTGHCVNNRCCEKNYPFEMCDEMACTDYSRCLSGYCQSG